MRILCTGGAGYLGSILVPMLLEAGHQVTVLDNFLYGQTSLLDWCGHTGLTIVRDDARIAGALSRSLAGADAILPLAAVVGAPACSRDPIAAQSTNLQAIRLLLRLRSPSQLIVFPNTNSGYGVLGSKETATEETPLTPQSLYAKLKITAEEALLQAEGTVSLRFATLFGPSARMRIDLLVNDFVWRAVVDGWIMLYEPHFRRPILHVRDAARAILWALGALADGLLHHRIYNVAAETVTKWELCEAIRRHLPFRWAVLAQGHDPDRRDYAVDCSRILGEGWQPERTLDEGITALCTAYTILGGRRRYMNV